MQTQPHGSYYKLVELIGQQSIDKLVNKGARFYVNELCKIDVLSL